MNVYMALRSLLVNDIEVQFSDKLYISGMNYTSGILSMTKNHYILIVMTSSIIKVLAIYRDIAVRTVAKWLTT